MVPETSRGYMGLLLDAESHLIAVPGKKEHLRLAIGEAHRRYTRRINFREGWRGHLWQEWFSSFVMDEHYLLACTRYIENNPVRANLVRHAKKWRWSSASAHISVQNDALVDVNPLLSIIKGDWRNFLGQRLSPTETDDIRKHAQTGRPLGDVRFVTRLECLLGRELRPRKPPEESKKKWKINILSLEFLSLELR